MTIKDERGERESFRSNSFSESCKEGCHDCADLPLPEFGC